ncbi:MAG TPA: sigma-70 family RNA polymerase sigma factor [Candidatus Heimdallarchaeota archaeon]|nr:sigma-70 family RNA polymerase sigma factor [Candidatus Heimdallarchaeota archaeon]
MSQQEHSEEKMLIVRAKRGDTKAFESLVRKYQKPIYYLCYRMTGAHQAADDLSQDVFIKAYFALSHFKEEMIFFAWIRKIAVNRAINYLKVWKREKSMGGDEMRVSRNPDASPQEMPEETYQRKQMVKTFKQALQELSAEQRAIFILKVYENQSYEQIAMTLNIPQGTVMSRLSRARQKLKNAMADYLQGGSR